MSRPKRYICLSGENDKLHKKPTKLCGGKYKLLKDIIPLFPENINTFVDLFGGGFNVGINVSAKQIVYNDIEPHVVGLMKYLSDIPTYKCLLEIDSLICSFNLSKENADGFNKLRDFYNNEHDYPLVFYTMICYAFNYQIRFNKNGKYNMPFGKNRSSFNPILREKFIKFTDELHNKNCLFSNESYKEFDFSGLNNSDFVYCDPPYFNSVAAYNEQGGWTEEDEQSLLEILDWLNSRNIKFALSNNFKYNNPILENWKNKYNVHYLNGDYSNCNYHKIDRSKDVEVLITNY